MVVLEHSGPKLCGALAFALYTLPLASAVRANPATRLEPALATEWDRPPPLAVDASLPRAARGFQAALRSGVQLPWGEASEAQGDELSARYAWQLPLLADIGFKLDKAVFLGLYGGLAYGGIGSSGVAEKACAGDGVSCSVLSYQIGVQAQYHLRPSERLNPWLGAGFGYEAVRQSLKGPTYSELQATSGVTLIKLMLGIDYRAAFGLGPFVEASAGRFQATRTEVDGVEVHEGPVEPSGWHGFLVFGARVVLLP